MSEYQYYEFAAIERPLTRAEMTALRAVSTRAVITPRSFVNHYEWGDLKADPMDWMRRYFDVFVYTANWCSSRLALRVPLATFRKADLQAFASKYALTIEARKEYWIFAWALDECEDYDRFAEDDGSGWMQRLAPLRDELLRGDLRPLYLGWLAGAGGDDLPDTALEPEVPPGLSELSAPQQALVEFLEIDPDLLSAAATGSASVTRNDVAEADRIDAWLDELSRDEMAAVLKLVAQGRGQEAERRVRIRHAAWLKVQQAHAVSAAPRRRVAELRELAKSASAVRLDREAQERAKGDAERRHRREAYLRSVMDHVDKHWKTIDALAQRGLASSYTQAVRALVDLAQGYALTSSREEFEHALRGFVARHAKRGALLRRLTDAGLWSR